LLWFLWFLLSWSVKYRANVSPQLAGPRWELPVSFLSPPEAKPTTGARLTEGSARRGAPRRWTLVATPSSATGATAPLTTQTAPRASAKPSAGPSLDKNAYFPSRLEESPTTPAPWPGGTTHHGAPLRSTKAVIQSSVTGETVLWVTQTVQMI